MDLVACKQHKFKIGGLRSSLVVSRLHSEAWHSRLVFTVKFGHFKIGEAQVKLVASSCTSEVWWHVVVRYGKGGIRAVRQAV